MKANSKPTFLKIVYFDEGSALDYLEAKHGGRYDKVSSDIIQRAKTLAGEVGLEVSTDPKLFSFIIDSLIGIKGRVSGRAAYDRKSETNISETVSSTVLSNFIDDVYESVQDSNFGIFNKINLSFIPNSITFLKTISPMLKIIKEESFEQQMPIHLGALDQIFSDAKGYYELISQEEGEKRVFRFNINALRNNYRLNDLTKMDITIIGIKVGECTEEQLEWEAEFNEEKRNEQKAERKSRVAHIIEDELQDEEKVPDVIKTLDIYDVILAGVVNNER
ncbi:DUF6414 family protein [Sporosarcina sp. FSL W7-1349]|uniref:DUF6414 family protein n=1 Tax=Sporosarcina sp. FSL W7-1349 TaxID=2921561 RepID=UPI0030F72484